VDPARNIKPSWRRHPPRCVAEPRTTPTAVARSGRSLSPIGRAASRAGINEIQCAALPGEPGVRRERRRVDMSSTTGEYRTGA